MTDDLHPEPYTQEGGPGLQAYIRDVLIMAWRQGYAVGRADARKRLLAALDHLD